MPKITITIDDISYTFAEVDDVTYYQASQFTDYVPPEGVSVIGYDVMMKFRSKTQPEVTQL